LAEERKAACLGRLDASVWGRDEAENRVVTAAPPAAWVRHQDAWVRPVSSVALQDAWVVRQGAWAFAHQEPLQDARPAPHRRLRAACLPALRVQRRERKALEDGWVAAKPRIPAARALQCQAWARQPAQEDAPRWAQQMAEHPALREALAGQQSEQ
jgi:hypothetical protein